MEEFDQFVQVLETLLGPNGCQWDRKQTFESLRKFVLEEAHEVVDAVNRKDYLHLAEELGDLLLNVVFYTKLGEKTGHFTLVDTLTHIREKLIRRHPHIFGETKDLSLQEVEAQWKEIKAKEGKPEQLLENLPSLARVQEILAKKIELNEMDLADRELQFAKRLWTLVEEAQKEGIDAEHSLLRLVTLKTQQ